MNREFIARYWSASVYEKFENQTDDVDFLLNVLATETDGNPQNVLEIACGGGRISIPLAQAGHMVTGFDLDEQMLLRCYRRMNSLPNIRIYKADACKTAWGKDFDVVVMACNLLNNIECDEEYMDTQKMFIQKAFDALKFGGYFYLDFELHLDPKPIYHTLQEFHCFTGIDDLGTSGRTVSYGSVYNPVTQICSGVNHIELTMNTGESFIYPNHWYKHIPTQAQVYEWLQEVGFLIERTYHNYTDTPVSKPIDETTFQMTIWARKM